MRLTVLLCTFTLMLALTALCYSPLRVDVQPSERGESYAQAAALAYEVHDLWGMGSGWAWDEDTLVTNWHVVSRMNLDDAIPEWVEKGDRAWVIVEIERLPGIDGALVHVEGDPLNVGKRGPSPRIGDWLLMVGSPHDSEDPIVTWGIGAGRYSPGAWAVDGAVIPGMSGGPVIDDQGRIVGMNVATTVPPGRSLGLIILMEEITSAVERLERERAAEPADRGGGSGDPGARRWHPQVP